MSVADVRARRFALAISLFALVQSPHANAQVEGSAAVTRVPIPGITGAAQAALCFTKIGREPMRSGYAVSGTATYAWDYAQDIRLAKATLGLTTVVMQRDGANPSFALGPTLAWLGMLSATVSYRHDPEFSRAGMPLGLTLPLPIFGNVPAALDAGVRAGPIWQWGDGRSRLRGGFGLIAAFVFHDEASGFGFDAGYDRVEVGNGDSADNVHLAFISVHLSPSVRRNPSKARDE